LKTEKDKFACYDNAKREMDGRDTHHYLVYGSKSDNQHLNLHARHYFSLNEVVPVLSILDCGLDNDNFTDYLMDLITLKKEDRRSDGTVGSESMASVVGISSNKVASISLNEYVRIAIPQLYQTLFSTENMSQGMSPS
jgi:hypothetical protein